MVIKRLINCDFFEKSNFKVEVSNKAKLLYFLFFTSADDYGFIGNGKDIAESLDRCEEKFENSLFEFLYVDAIHELINKKFLYEFVDSVGNRVYLIKHWFLHNKEQQFLTTNYTSYLEQVEVVNGKYQFKNHQEKKPLKENKIKENKTNQNLKSNSLKVIDNDLDNSNEVNTNNKSFDEILDEIEERDNKENKL